MAADDLSTGSLTVDQELDGENAAEGEVYQQPLKDPEAVENDIVSIAETDSNSEDEDEEPALKKMKTIPKITAYIDIIAPARSTKAKETAITRGPFFFTIETSHWEFLSLVATTAAEKNTAAGIGSINQSQLLWKLNVPANDKKKPLSNEQGYEALTVVLKNCLTAEKSKDSSITIIMPPLLKNTLATGMQGDLDEEELTHGPIGSTIREQKTVIGMSNYDILEQLRQKHPIGTDARWPAKRIYASPDGRCWELNDIRLQVWAHHIAATPPTATMELPPTSTHFADSQRLRAPAAAANTISNAMGQSGAPNVTQGEPMMANPHMTNYPQMPTPYGFPQYPMQYFPPFPYFPFYPAPHAQDGNAHGAKIPGLGSPPVSPAMKVQLPRPVSLDEFCKHYEIDDCDKERLEKLRFLPGDRRVERLEREDWHDDAGFSRLAWDDFLSKHKIFLRDVEAGCWKA